MNLITIVFTGPSKERVDGDFDDWRQRKENCGLEIYSDTKAIPSRDAPGQFKRVVDCVP